MIFISGVHGVGKSYFCNLLKNRLGVVSYSASTLIADKKNAGFFPDKLVADIDENQFYLLEAVRELRERGDEFLLDGHFCLLNKKGLITRIPIDTFTTLAPDAIVLLTEDPNIIAKRRQDRDGIQHSISDIQAFQDAEKAYANEVAELLGVPLKVSAGSKDVDRTIEFIKNRRD
ncbi:ATP-binding protein [Solobacterium moorei]|uniref:ATP-binding protein n=1 Tax=Solobacterium moorei TaxID=102148 RepID=UPI0028E47D51|nr:ATP-binding protein [Solobacterium moorei]